MKRILVVGGAGFIGSHVNKLLDKAGFQTIILDNLSIGSKKSVTRGTFVEGDMADIHLLDKIFTQYKIDAVMHLAGNIEISESIQNPSKYYQNNVVNALNVLNAMLRHQVKIFVFSSSAAVYGVPETPLIKESHPCNPIHPYGATKLMVERILHDFDQAYGIRYSSLRYFNAAGGDPDGEVKNFKKRESNLIPIVLRQGSATIFGTDYDTRDGTCIRDYVHVCDLADAHIVAMQRLLEGGPSTTYNLGNGEGYTVREIIHAIEKITKKKVDVIEGDRRKGDVPILLADSEKAWVELGWKPKYPEIETIVEHAWNAL